MITMVDKNQILLMYYRDGANKSFISSKLGISRKTVRKYISEHESLYGKDFSIKSLEAGLTSKPSYDTSSREKIKLSREIEEEIKYCLEENQKKRNSGLGKQQQKKIDIYQYLIEKGYKIGYTTVCNYIRKQENYRKEVFIKQVYSPGFQSEFDWGKVKLYIAGNLQTFNLAIFTSSYSNHRWAKLFNRQDTLSFSQSHIDYFSYLGGVHKELVYDNMRVAIKRFVGRSEKEPTEALLELSNYYKFGFRFCNAYKGNEKGHVERSVEYVRRKAFSSKLYFSSLQEANKHLLETIEKLNNAPRQLKENQTADELFAEEKQYLYKVSVAYKCFKEEKAKVDKYSTVLLYGNRYSVPDYLVGKWLNIKLFAEKIDFYFNKDLVCSHPRNYGLQGWTIDINHYLTTLFRKPGALKNSLAFKQQSEEVQLFYENYFSQNSKDFIELLQYCKEYSIDWTSIKSATEYLKKTCPTNINKDTILAVISNQNQPKQEGEEIKDEIYHSSMALLRELTTKFN